MGFLVFLSAFFSGVVGGMGMGGGTFLIPLLRALGVSQHSAQTANLISFIPMCFVALIIHGKNGLLRISGTGWTVVFAFIGAFIGSFSAQKTSPELLRRIFGVFLLCFGVYQAVTALKRKSESGLSSGLKERKVRR